MRVGWFWVLGIVASNITPVRINDWILLVGLWLRKALKYSQKSLPICHFSTMSPKCHWTQTFASINRQQTAWTRSRARSDKNQSNKMFYFLSLCFFRASIASPASARIQGCYWRRNQGFVGYNSQTADTGGFARSWLSSPGSFWTRSCGPRRKFGRYHRVSATAMIIDSKLLT